MIERQLESIRNMVYHARAQAADAAQALQMLFVSRRDAYAVQNSPEEIKAGRAYSKIDAPVTLDLIREHLAGKITIGVYSIEQEAKTVRSICWDLDRHPEELPTEKTWMQIVDKVKEDANKLLAVITKQYDEKATLLEFSGCKGVHLWLFWDPPIPANLAYALGREIAQQAGVVCEVFPKQSDLLKGYGNLTKLPLGLHRESGLRSTLFIREEKKKRGKKPEWEWKQVDANYILQIEPAFLMMGSKEVKDLIARLTTTHKPWMAAEVGSGVAYTGDDPPCLVKYLSGMSIPIGQRHEVFRRIGCYYLQFKGLAKKGEEGFAFVHHVLEEWNKHNQPPYDQTRFDGEWQKLREGFEYNYSCQDEYWMRTCDPQHCPMKIRQMQSIPGEISVDAVEKAKELAKDPVRFLQFLQRCLNYRLAAEYRNRLFMFLAAVAAQVQTTLIRLYGANAAGKKMLYYWLVEIFGEDKVVILSSATAAWLKRKVMAGFDTRGKIIILIETRGDKEAGIQYTFEQVYSEDKIKIGFNVAGKEGKSDWEPVEVTLQGPLCFITTSTELEESFHASTREWEVNPDESQEQSNRISEWQNRYELRGLKQEEREKKDFEVLRAYVSLLKPWRRYVIAYIDKISFKYRSLADRRKKPDFSTLIRAVTYLFQEHYCPKDKENNIIFAPPFTFDIVSAAAKDIIAVSRGGVNQTEKRILTMIQSENYPALLSVTKEGKQPEKEITREKDGVKILIREAHPACAFTAADIARHPDFHDLHEKTIRENLKGLTRKGYLLQTVTGKGKPGVWVKMERKTVTESEELSKDLTPDLQPVTQEDLEMNTSKIYEGMERQPNLEPGWHAAATYRISKQDQGLNCFAPPEPSIAAEPLPAENPPTPATEDVFGPLKPDENQQPQ